jgi:subtilisin family serine protease
MKLIFRVCLILLIVTEVRSQTVYPGYIDGRIYMKVSGRLLPSLLNEDPENIHAVRLTYASEIFQSYGVTRIRRPFSRATDDDVLPCVLKIEFSKVAQVDAFISDLERLKEVDYVEKVPLAVTHATPNDFSILSTSQHLTQINAPQAWNIFNGNSNITVAIVDNAVMWTHADLVANTYTNAVEAAGTTGVDDDGNGYIDDIHGWDAADNDNDPLPWNTNVFHGTHVAGVAGASTNNNTGVASIGWNIKIIPVKGEPNSGSAFSVTNGYEGILYAVKAKARIISCSWGSGNSSVTEQYCVNYAWNRGCILFASAGNNNNNVPNYPGAYNHVFCVAAVDASDIRWSLSSFGSWVDIAAPGDNIMSTMPYVGTPTYQAQSGTSFATPLVAGLAGLMLSKSPNMTQTDVLNCLSSTAVNISTLSGNSGYAMGAGRIDAFAAMSCAATYSALPPVANFYAFPLNTCPNTPVNFYDSSLYAPASWSWVFQGGSPATSTLANPVVSYSATGTYSVLLTASNANGTSNKTKLSYITVAGPVPLPFFEGFQGTQFLPSGWTPNNIGNDELYWDRYTGVGGYGTSTACARFNNYDMNAPNERDEMRSPKFDFSNVASATLHFDVAYARWNSGVYDSLEVKLSTSCGTTFTPIYTKGGSALATAPDIQNYFTPTSSQWRTDAINISSLTAGQGNVMFSFINRGHYGQPIYLDNINLTFPTPTVNAAFNGSACVGIPVTFTNTSISAASYTWNIQGAPASTLVSPAVTFTAPGTYTIVLTGANGTSTASTTKTIQVFSIPVMGTANATVCAGQQATLTASGASSYQWAGGPATSINIVSPTITTVYTVTGMNGGVCSAAATVTVLVNNGPAMSVPAQSVCAGGSVTLTATGANSYTWSTGSNASSIAVTPSATSAYSVSGTNAACTSTITTLVTVLGLPVSTFTIQNPPCDVICNGKVYVSSVGGTSPYTYSLSNSCVSFPCVNVCIGTYTLSTTDAAGCVSLNTLSVGCISTGIATLNGLSAFNAYPNPASSAITIEGTPLFDWMLYNNLGQLVMFEKNCRNTGLIDVSALARGIYTLVLSNETTRKFNKIVLE